MRMWMAPVQAMCRQHLLGEHLECHMFLGAIRKGTSLTGYIDRDLFEPLSLQSRHDELASEMLRRGFKHKSPLLVVESDLRLVSASKRIDRVASVSELFSRCEQCRKRRPT